MSFLLFINLLLFILPRLYRMMSSEPHFSHFNPFRLLVPLICYFHFLSPFLFRPAPLHVPCLLPHTNTKPRSCLWTCLFWSSEQSSGPIKFLMPKHLFSHFTAGWRKVGPDSGTITSSEVLIGHRHADHFNDSHNVFVEDAFIPPCHFLVGGSIMIDWNLVDRLPIESAPPCLSLAPVKYFRRHFWLESCLPFLTCLFRSHMCYFSTCICNGFQTHAIIRCEIGVVRTAAVNETS
jgi:hypothetical protein